jgi:hypothetical protein
MRKPALDLKRDLYISPMDIVDLERPVEAVWLEKNRQVTLGNAYVSFTGFRMESHEDLVVYADLRVEHDGRVDHVSTGLKSDANGSTPIPVDVPGLGVVRLARIDADHGRVALVLPGTAPAQAAIVELSTKPLVNLVWIGALLALLGTALAGLRRAMERGPARGRGATHPSVGAGVPQAAP